MIRTKNSTAESADNGSPRFAVEGNKAEPGGRLHVSHAGSSTAPRARPRCWLAPPHLLPLVHQKTETHHPRR
ncbi:hypothetical protein AHAS_Ahas18G0084200 [Arachis hypogaea]